MKEKVTLTMKEQRRLMVISEVERGGMRGGEAAQLLGLSLRHFRRMIAAYRKDGAVALAHGNRGRKPANAIGKDKRELVVYLADSIYAGFNHKHFTELLAEREDIFISRSSVRNILLSTGVRTPRKRKAPRHRSRRNRYPKEGMLLQLDGSPHDWLQGRGPEMSLVGAIDDATGKVSGALFREQEDSLGYFILMKNIVIRYGIPQAVYHDRHSIFEVSADEQKHPSIQDQLSGKPMLTQFGRLMSELGITSISAHSPQAKGRIERLWGTFQDRLVNEMRLAGISTLEEANRFLESFIERYNARFVVPADQPELAYQSAQGLDIENMFCFKHERVAGADNVIRFKGQRIQILPSNDRLSYARCSVQVHVQLDGTIKVYYQGRCLDTCTAPDEATKIRSTVGSKKVALADRPRQIPRPASNHPWRRWVQSPDRK